MIWLVIILFIINFIQLIIHLLNKEEKKVINKRMLDKLKVQGQNGAYNYDEYNLGMYNGMALMYATFKREPADYIDPKKITFMKEGK